MVEPDKLEAVEHHVHEATVESAYDDERLQHALYALSLLMDALYADASYAAFYCPTCDWFRIGLTSGDLDVCGDCDTTLMEKVLTTSTVFRAIDRADARVEL